MAPSQAAAHLNGGMRWTTKQKIRGVLAGGTALVALYAMLSTRRRRVQTVQVLRSAVWAFRSRTMRALVLVALLTWLGLQRLGWSKRYPWLSFRVTMGLVWVIFYYFRVVEHGKAQFQRTFFNVQIAEKARLTQEKFRPVFWAYNAHAQTVICLLIAHLEVLLSKKIRVARETIEGWDGNPLFIDWLHLGKDQENGIQHDLEEPIILLVHGLGDDTSHPYMKRFARMCRSHGWHAVAFSYWRLDFGETRDLKQVVEHIHATNPRAPLIAIAWSAGGHLLLKYLGSVGKDTPIVAAITNSGCFDLMQACQDVYKSENSSYKVFLTLQVRECARRHLLVDKRIDNPEAFKQPLGLDMMEFYDKFLYMAPSSSAVPNKSEPYVFLKTMANHYKESAISLVDNVQVSTLVLHARDDPVVSFDHIDWNRVAQNRHIIRLTTRRGGHCSWYEGMLPFGATWADRVSSNFISAVLETHSQTHFLINALKEALREEQEEEGYGKGKGKAKGGPILPNTMARICSSSDFHSLDLKGLR